MSFSLISIASNSSSPLVRKLPIVSEFYSSFSAYPFEYYFHYHSSSTNFRSTTIHSHLSTSFRPVNSISNSSSSAEDYSLVDISSPSASAADDELGVSDSDDEKAHQEHEIQTTCSYSSSLPDRWHVLGLGQAMVDFSGIVDDEFLVRLGLNKGTRKIVNHEERGKVLRAMDGCSYKAAAGGSLSNTLSALARLGGQALNIAMAGSVGSDPLGGFYRSKLQRANVKFLSAPVWDGTTGTVIVLTTPDAQRTMLAYQGTSSRVNYDPCLASLISKTSILIVEGYLFEFPDTIKTIARACEEAHKCGALVAITASDVTCIERHYDDFWDIMANYADIIFANSDEARAFCHFPSGESPVCATRYLSHFVPFVSVTDGRKGSYIGVKGEAVYIPPSPCVPVDTCGAGDAYASGILYGLLRGVSDLRGMGSLASKVASIVVSQQGTRLRVKDVVELAESFLFHHESSTMSS
ncbi:pfkB-like carbohydrate kinase family protein [Striga hermonthica]|uniref:PfkB-like carbohydrate kinase family protein n=1 Tax=Striga hermonthica TaxID=68872 RepID=A0A9N7MN24_STRHE|nr:pfkB-like carbohydrate kinase family protein [Striga hermonthica]